MKALIAVPALCLAMNAAAGCPVNHPRQQPQIPDAAVATQQEMHRAELAAEQYLLQGKTYLECGYMNSRQYKKLASQLGSFAERYNEEALEYQSRSQMVADIEPGQTVPVSRSAK